MEENTMEENTMEENTIEVSALPKTWIFDLDGTIVKHNGYKLDGIDALLPGAREFLDKIPEDDMVIFITSREEQFRTMTEDFLKKENIRYHSIIFGSPYGERILVNDKKPSGLPMAYAVNAERNHFMEKQFVINSEL